jgi:hypothetical protein
VRASGLPHLAAQLPPNFRSPSAVNSFIYSLAEEVTAGRLERHTAAVLGYLAQLAIQTLPLLRLESGPAPAEYITWMSPLHPSRLAARDAAMHGEPNTTSEGIQP